MDKAPLTVALVFALLLGANALPLVQAAPDHETLSRNATVNTTTASTASLTIAQTSADDNRTNRTTPAGSSNGTLSANDPCAGMGSVESAVCTGIHKGFGTVLGGFIDGLADSVLTKLQNGAETFVEVLVSRPVPLRNGQMELAQRPTNPPMGTVYDLWLTVGLPAGIAVWGLMMLIMRLTAFLPSRMAPVMQSRKKLLEGWFALFRILASWIWCALILHLTLGIAVTFAPSGEQIITGFESLSEAAVGAGITALVLYLSSGVLFVLVLLVFGLSFLAPFVLMPAYPLFIAISVPDFWIFKWFAQKGEFLRSLFAPAAFMPVPTAIILGTGYPVLNAIRGSLSGPIASIAGIPTYIILLLVMWFTALIAPVFLFLGARKMRPLTMFAAGALGAATTMNVSRGAKGLRGRLQRPSIGGSSSSDTTRNAGVGRTVDPLEGSPFSRDNAGGFGGSLNGSDGASIAGSIGTGGFSSPGGRGPPAPAFNGTGGTSSAGGQSASTSSSSAGSTSGRGSSTDWERVTDRSAQAYAESVPDDVEFKQATSRTELDRNRYDAGYFDSRGEFRTLSQGPSNSGWLLDEGGFNTIAAKKAEEPVLAYDEANDEAYDVRDVVQDGEYRRARYERQRQDSINTVERTRNR